MPHRWATLAYKSVIIFRRKLTSVIALSPPSSGRGIASEAVRAVCDYAFREAGVKAINAWVLAENRGSVRLLEKLGFVRTQVLEKAFEINGIHYDDWGYRLEMA